MVNILREAEDRIEGWADFELTEKVKRQAKAVTEKMRKENMDVLYTSFLARAKETAEFVGEAIDLEAIDLQDAKAMNCGLSGGLMNFDAEVLYPKPYDHKTPHYKS